MMIIGFSVDRDGNGLSHTKISSGAEYTSGVRRGAFGFRDIKDQNIAADARR